MAPPVPRHPSGHPDTSASNDWFSRVLHEALRIENSPQNSLIKVAAAYTPAILPKTEATRTITTNMPPKRPRGRRLDRLRSLASKPPVRLLALAVNLQDRPHDLGVEHERGTSRMVEVVPGRLGLCSARPLRGTKNRGATGPFEITKS